jgi:hypothetical protein
MLSLASSLADPSRVLKGGERSEMKWERKERLNREKKERKKKGKEKEEVSSHVK